MYLSWFILLVLCATSSSFVVPNSKNEIKSDTLTLLTEESKKARYPFNITWQESQLETFYSLHSKSSKRSKDLNTTYIEKGILTLSEVRILICYCYNSHQFFQKLNKDLRENCGKQYPVAIEVLKSAITKLMNYQSGTEQSLPEILYRNENNSLFETYQNLFDRSEEGVLTQFTSTSRNKDTAQGFNTAEDRMVIKFEHPQVGADIDDFSIYDEFEVLLPVSAHYKVKKAIKDKKNEFVVVISGPKGPISGSSALTSGSKGPTSSALTSGSKCPNSGSKGPTSGQKKFASDIIVVFVLVMTIKFI